MPPAPIRRPLTITVWLIVSVICLVLSPVLLVIAALAGMLMRRRQPLIVARLIVAYFLRELGALIACGTLWLGSGAGRLIRTPRFQLLHWRLLAWFVHGLAELALSLLQIDVAPDSSPEAIRAMRGEKPLIIFSRHAGPGDTLLLVDQLLCRFERHPSVVFKETLALDPCIDLIAHRLPHAVLDTDDREECEAKIKEVAGQLGPRGALLLFPEGGNFTVKRRKLALANLRRKGRHRAAAKAERMSHVLPPRPSGAVAALNANPEADVIFAAHTGLGLAAFPRELWREMPIGKTLQTRMWLVAASDVPDTADQQVTWLYDWWKQIDEWVDQQRSETPSATSTGA